MSEPTRHLRLSWGGATDQGRVRAANQDAMHADRGLFVVADGMGGHQGGEVAANLAVRTVVSEPHDTTDNLIEAITTANRLVHDTAIERPDLHGMGTTLTAISVVDGPSGPRFTLANVGDSRIYRFRDSELLQLTFDHSYVGELMRRGDLTAEEAASHPYRNMLTRAVGVNAEVEVDRWEIEPSASDRYLLCSDGVTNELSDEEISSILSQFSPVTAAARALVEAANDRGGRDNSTVIIVDVTIDEPTEASDTPLTGVIPVPPPEPEQQTGLLPLVTPDSVELDSTEPEEDTDESSPPEDNTHEDDPPEEVPPEDNTPEDNTPETSANDDAMERFLNEAPSFVDTAQPRFHETAEPTPSDTKQRSWLSEPVAITTRGVGVMLGLVAVGIGIIGFAGWYGRSGYHVGVAGDEVVVYQGRIGGLWWFDPTLEERTGVFLVDLTEDDRSAVADGHSTESLTGAQVYVEELRTRMTITPTADSSTDDSESDPAPESDESAPSGSAG